MHRLQQVLQSDLLPLSVTESGKAEFRSLETNKPACIIFTSSSSSKSKSSNSSSSSSSLSRCFCRFLRHRYANTVSGGTALEDAFLPVLLSTRRGLRNRSSRDLPATASYRDWFCRGPLTEWKEAVLDEGLDDSDEAIVKC